MLKTQMSETEKTVFTTMPSPYGELTIQSNSQGLLGLWLVTYTTKPDQLGEYVAREQLQTALPPQAILAQTVLQLEQYFSGQRAQFDLPLAATGTAFQQQVWQALTDIPYGETCSYQDIANAIGNPKAVRAVGLANGKNPISIIVPCHRVIGKNGKLTGYAGGVEVKQGLLETEARNK